MATYKIAWDATGTGDGSSWENAYTTIQAALTARSGANDFEVSGGIAGHEYNEAITCTASGQHIFGSTESGHDGRVTIHNYGTTSHAVYTGSPSITNIRLTSLNVSNRVIGKRGLHNSAEGSVFTDIGFDDSMEYMFYADLGCDLIKCFSYHGGVVVPGANKYRIRLGAAEEKTWNFVYCKFDDMYAGVYLAKGNVNFINTQITHTFEAAFRSDITLATTPSTIKNSIFSGGYDKTSPAVYNVTQANLVISNSVILPNYVLNTVTAVDGGGCLGVSPNAAPSPMWTGNRYQPVVMLQFDDNEIDDFAILAAKLEEYGYRGTIGVVSAGVTAAQWVTLRGLAARGHEVASHTRRHVNLTTFTAFTISKADTSITIDNTAHTLTATGGVSIDLSLAKYNIAYGGVAALLVDLAALDFTVAATANAYAGNGAAINLEDGTWDISAAKTINYDQSRTYQDEIRGSKAEIEANIGGGYVCNFFVPPGDLSSEISRQWAAEAGFLGARGSVTSEQVFPYGVDIYELRNRTIFSQLGLYAETPAKWRNIALSAVSYSRFIGYYGIVTSLYTHNLTDISIEQYATILGIFQSEGIQCFTATEAIARIKSEGVLSGSSVYTNVTQPSDICFSLSPDSPCIDAGVDVGLASDIEGEPIYGPPDIGAYEYQYTRSIAPITTPGPLRADLTITAGIAYPDLTVTAPLGPEFQAIPEWTGGAAVDLSTLVPTANTRTGQLGVAVWNPGLDAAEIVRADKVLGA